MSNIFVNFSNNSLKIKILGDDDDDDGHLLRKNDVLVKLLQFRREMRFRNFCNKCHSVTCHGLSVESATATALDWVKTSG